MSEIRQRKPENQELEKDEKPSPAARAKAEDSAFSLLDLARGLVFLLLVSGAISYFVTRESFVWGVGRPNFTRWDVVKTWIVSPPSAPPIFSQLHIWNSLTTTRRAPRPTPTATSRPSTAPTPPSPSCSPSTAPSTTSRAGAATTGPAGRTTSSPARTARAAS